MTPLRNQRIPFASNRLLQQIAFGIGLLIFLITVPTHPASAQRAAIMLPFYATRSEICERILDRCATIRVQHRHSVSIFVVITGTGKVKSCDVLANVPADARVKIISTISSLTFTSIWNTGNDSDEVAMRIWLGGPCPSMYDTSVEDDSSLIIKTQRTDVELGILGSVERQYLSHHQQSPVVPTRKESNTASRIRISKLMDKLSEIEPAHESYEQIVLQLAVTSLFSGDIDQGVKWFSCWLEPIADHKKAFSGQFEVSGCVRQLLKQPLGSPAYELGLRTLRILDEQLAQGSLVLSYAVDYEDPEHFLPAFYALVKQDRALNRQQSYSTRALLWSIVILEERRKNFTAALAACQNLIDLFPSSINSSPDTLELRLEASAELARLCVIARDEKHLKQALHLAIFQLSKMPITSPDEINVGYELLKIADAMIDRSDLSGAEQVIRAVLPLTHPPGLTMLRLADTYAKQGLFKHAENFLSWAIETAERGPKKIDAAWLMVSYSDLLLEKAKSITSPSVHHNLMLRSAVAFDKAIAAFPKDTWPALQMARHRSFLLEECDCVAEAAALRTAFPLDRAGQYADGPLTGVTHTTAR
jgi:tetratricopeptide (TPR) repeat protein